MMEEVKEKEVVLEGDGGGGGRDGPDEGPPPVLQ